MSDINPRSYDEQIDNKIAALENHASATVAEEKDSANEKAWKTSKKYDETISHLEAQMHETPSYLKVAFITSLMVFAVVFFGSCALMPDHESERQFAESLGITLTREGEYVEFGMWIWFGTPGVAFVVTLIVMGIIRGLRDKSLSAQIAKEKSKQEAELSNISKSTAERIERVQAETEQEISRLREEKNAHRKKYEEKLRKDSVRYANSTVAQEIIELLLDGFKRSIEAADRRPHVQSIDVPFSFKVFKNRVETPYGEYDFKIKRVSCLKDFSEQSALANAIAQNVHTEIIVSYPDDISGGAVIPMEIDFDYGANYVSASMTYRAINANYVPPRSF